MLGLEMIWLIFENCNYASFIQAISREEQRNILVVVLGNDVVWWWPLSWSCLPLLDENSIVDYIMYIFCLLCPPGSSAMSLKLCKSIDIVCEHTKAESSLTFSKENTYTCSKEHVREGILLWGTHKNIL